MIFKLRKRSPLSRMGGGLKLNTKKGKYMITALVHYKKWVDVSHALLDGVWVDHSKVVKVSDLLELNDLFRHITKIDILNNSDI